MISAEQIRKRMRIAHAFTDDEIESNIQAARHDMSRVGIDVGKDDALIDKALELYCKGQFNYLGKGEEFLKNYERTRDAMSMSRRYRCGTK